MASPDIDMADVTGENEPLMEPVDDGSDVAEGTTPAITDMGPAEKPEEDDPNSGEYTWEIERFSQLTDLKVYSDNFEIGGYQWRMLVFPKGNKVSSLSVYLDVPDTELLPFNWTRSASFKLSVMSHGDPAKTYSKDTNHTFSTRESDWGFTSFIELDKLHNPANELLAGDTLVLKVEVSVKKTTQYTYDSRAETGFVGLKNQGATCYMNSLLQTLYHIPYFRKAVYHMPTTDEDAPVKSIPLALQSLFYKIQFQPTSVSTKMLTKSFGWDTYDSFMQHDVQELNRVLCEKLEEKMKSTTVEGTIEKLFQGHTWNYIECVNVAYKSTRTESFMDLQLDVKGCKDLYASFDKYTEVEMLDGQNQYKADGHGLQDAKKGVLFDNFPPVLQLQLKRFEYDFARDMMVKINDRYEFFDELDLDVQEGRYLSPSADRSVRNLYKLHSVLVHSGGVHGGHYYAFIRPDGQTWYRFDDERVTKEDSKRALDDQFGEDEGQPNNGQTGFNNLAFKLTKYSNAYMLVYVRKSDWDNIQCHISEEDIAEHLRVRLKAEQEEKEQKRKEKQEAHLYTYMKVATIDDMKEQIGSHRFFDLVDHDKVKSLRVAKQSMFANFKQQVAEQLGVPVEKQRFWLWAKRQNHTFRPNRPLSPHEEAQRVMDVKDNTTAVKHAVADLKLLLEPLQPNGELHKLDKNEIMLFFKLYLPETQELKLVGCAFAHKNDRINILQAQMCQMAGFPPSTHLSIFEEIKFEPSVMCEKVPPNCTLASAQLEHGDIIVFQRALTPEVESKCTHPSIKSYLDYVRNRQVVTFKPQDNPKDEGFQIELSKENTYDEVCEALAAELQRLSPGSIPDASYLRLTSHNIYSNIPKPTAIKYRGAERLTDMLLHYNQLSDILYYEVLDMPLQQLERLKCLKVEFHNDKVEPSGTHQVRLPKESTVGDVLDAVAKELKGEYTGADLRLIEVFYSKIFKVFSASERIDTINDQYWTLRCEVIPEEERNLGPGDKIIHVYHMAMEGANNSVVQNFGDPFFMVVREAETLQQLKPRIQAKLGVKDEEFAKWKFAFVPMSLRPEYYKDDDAVAPRFGPRSAYTGGNDQNYLGLEHADKNPKRHTQSSNYERPVKIYN